MMAKSEPSLNPVLLYKAAYMRNHKRVQTPCRVEHLRTPKTVSRHQKMSRTTCAVHGPHSCHEVCIREMKQSSANLHHMIDDGAPAEYPGGTLGRTWGHWTAGTALRKTCTHPNAERYGKIGKGCTQISVRPKESMVQTGHSCSHQQLTCKRICGRLCHAGSRRWPRTPGR
jgi:hypothetical protein